ncbi:rho family-interacting cell polarization regulator 2 isoform X3 [Folsomia candida]|uniref:rho family-interacting cell polarization regulator 2 isoform X3 n=1 Tax=Folsomia candida TaxID=158441 RepID=UPI001604F3C4|nr:rho family-interacting cell polarization regulator 2 isoform X3 [Folsomia candida]
MGSVSRSKSFNSSQSILLTRPVRYPPPPASLSRSCSRGTKYGYLGQNIGPPSSGSHSSPLGTLVKVNPNKTTATISGLQSGLKGAIKLIQDQINRNNADLVGQQSQGRIYDLEKNAKSLTLQLKTLEYQLSRLDSLEEEYTLQQRLREGVRSMAYAYTLSTGHHQKLALANVKAGFRECTESLGALEGQLQQFLGAFHLTMKGIQGFARLCPGDVYEIVVKHGVQKWKTRTKVNKDGGQEWDYPEAKIIPILGQDLFIKAAEVKTLGKQVLLGNKFCEICHLFSAHPQLMTVNLNPSGSLKLNLMVEWDPLAQFYHPGASCPTIGVSEAESPQRKRRMLICTPNNSSYTSSMTRTSPSSMSSSGGDSIVSSIGRHHHHPRHSSSSSPSVGEELRESLSKLAAILNDEIQGQYSELELVEVNVTALRRLAFQEWPTDSLSRSRYGPRSSSCNGGATNKKGARSSLFFSGTKSASTSSLNIESALEAFSFLDSEISSPQSEEVPPPRWVDMMSSSTPQCSLRLLPVEEESIKLIPTKKSSNGTTTTTTSDSGISSLTSTSSRSPSPGDISPYVTGSEQLDIVLHTHIQLCLKFVNNLGSFGPLKWKENNALTKLHQQGVVLSNILNLIRTGGGVEHHGSRNNNQHEAETVHHPFELERMPFIHALWNKITSTTASSNVTTADQVAYTLEGEIRKFHPNPNDAPHLAKSIVLQMLDETVVGGVSADVDMGALFQLERHRPLTLLQFISYLKPYEASFPRLVNDIAEEEFLAQQLSSPTTRPSQVEHILSSLQGHVPPTPVFLPLIILISPENANSNSQTRSAVTNYVLGMANSSRRREILENCLELLEWEEAAHRLASLSVLELIRGWEEVMEEVAYLAQTDADLRVRDAAKRFLLKGKEGGRMHEQLTLSSNGFQGLLAN